MSFKFVKLNCQACVQGESIDVGDLKMSDHTLTAESGCIMMRNLGEIVGYHAEGAPQAVSTTPKKPPPTPPPVTAPVLGAGSSSSSAVPPLQQPPPPSVHSDSTRKGSLSAELEIASGNMVVGSPLVEHDDAPQLEMQRSERNKVPAESVRNDYPARLEAERIAGQSAMTDDRQLGKAGVPAPRPAPIAQGASPAPSRSHSYEYHSRPERTWQSWQEAPHAQQWNTSGWTRWERWCYENNFTDPMEFPEELFNPLPPLAAAPPPQEPESGNAWAGWDAAPTQ